MNPALEYTATVGFFDGVHAGHRYLIEELRKQACRRGQKSMVVTFRVHPRKVLHSDFQPRLLTSFPERIAIIESLGVDKCVAIDFTLEMAEMSAFDFLKKVLKEQLGVKTLLVGHDHRFGHNRVDGFAEYQQYGQMLGMEVVQATRYKTDNELHVSSSEIRHALERGDVRRAATLLTRPYSMSGRVVTGFKVGRDIGFPTANLELEESDKLLPSNGVYAVKVNRKGVAYKAMMNIGTRPTLNNGYHISLEVHILDFEEDIYHEFICVEFIARIRDEKKFGSIEELVEQLKNDRERVRLIIDS